MRDEIVAVTDCDEDTFYMHASCAGRRYRNAPEGDFTVRSRASGARIPQDVIGDRCDHCLEVLAGPGGFSAREKREREERQIKRKARAWKRAVASPDAPGQ